MKALKIETRFDLDESSTVTIFREIADMFENENMESRELMDGSYRIETSLGIAFLSIIEEE